MSYYEQLLKQRGIKLSEEARIARGNIRTEKPLPKVKDLPDEPPISLTLKLCSYCQYVKPVAEFYKDAGRRDGRESRCKACKRAVRQQQWQGYTKKARA